MHPSTVRIRAVKARWVIVVAALTALPVLAARAARAQTAPTRTQLEDQERRIRELEDTVKQLKKDERQLEINAENQKPLAGWSDGFNLASQDGKYKLRIGGYTQLDGRFFINDRADNLTSQFLFRRARLDFSGTVFKYFDFRILPDFAQPSSSSSVVLYDAYVDANFIPEAELRIGKFKPPVGLERLQGAPYIEFIERAQPTNLVPSRDFGGQLFGTLLGGALQYQLALVDGVPDNSNPTSGDANDDKDFDGRIFALPFRNTAIGPLKGFGVGLAGSYGRQRGSIATPDLPTYKTFGQATYFQYKGVDSTGKINTIASGARHRYSPQTYYYFGPFGFLAEYVESEQGVKRDKTSKQIANDAWQIAGSFVLTGEAASFAGVIPAQPFDPFTGKWGAWEVAARYGQLVVDSDAFSPTTGFANPDTSARRNKEWVLGLNWYLNRNIKFVLDYAHSDFKGGAPKGGDRPTESAVVGRVQLLL